MGSELEDPVRRQRMVFERDGNVLRADVWTRPGGDVPAHFHPSQRERFKVVSGSVEFQVGGRRLQAEAGDEVVADPGVRHAFKNNGRVDALVKVEVEPALDLQGFLEEAAALARAGKYTQRGIPRGIGAAAELADLMERYSHVTVMAFPPLFVQRRVLPLLARAARRRS